MKTIKIIQLLLPSVNLKDYSVFKIKNLLKLKLLFLQLIAFSIPLAPYILPALIFILMLIWLYEGDFKVKWDQIKNNSLSLWLPSLFLLYLLGVIWSNNISYAISDLETKLALILFPIIIISLKIDKAEIQTVKDSFIQGTILAVSLLLIFSYYRYNLFNDTSFFYYKSFSILLHPSYFALYLNLSIVLILEKIFKNKLKFYWLTFYFISVFILLLAIFLSSSKSGIFSLFFSLGIGTVLFISKKWLLRLFFIITVFLIAFLLYLKSVNNKSFNFLNLNKFSSLVDPTKDRFNDLYGSLIATTIDNTTTSSSSVRLLVWETALDIGIKNPLLGVGTGDVKAILIENYKEKGITGAVKNNLNAHNQYLQTTVALGLIGLFVLLINLFFPLFLAFKYKSWIFLLFILLISFNFLTESLLERQAGVIFFAFFNCLFLISLKQNKNDPILSTQN